MVGTQLTETKKEITKLSNQLQSHNHSLTQACGKTVAVLEKDKTLHADIFPLLHNIVKTTSQVENAMQIHRLGKVFHS